MGCGISSKLKVGAQNDVKKSARYSFASLSQAQIGRGLMSSLAASAPSEITTNWRQLPKHKRTSLIENPEMRELIEILDEPLGQGAIGTFCKKIYTSEALYCWCELQDFKSVSATSYGRSLAKHIFEKYVIQGAKMEVNGLLPRQVETYKKKLQSSMANPSLLEPTGFFSELEELCLKNLVESTFRRFKGTDEYHNYKRRIRDTYNNVSVEDFEYMGLLGAGGFGRVVHVRKKSTGRHYAMKIQLKSTMLQDSKDSNKVMNEKSIYASCRSPFIVGMHYSFQTEAHAIIVLELIRGGNLHEYCNKVSRIPHKQAVLFVAEIALAINHLHESAFIYRDLKPENVLLGEDGHIRLADFGLAVGSGNPGDWEAVVEESGGNILGVANRSEKDRTLRTRSKSLVGTRGFLAPEMLQDHLRLKLKRKGYNKSIDYWALGVTAYKLICGTEPFESCSDRASAANKTEKHQSYVDLSKMEEGVTFPADLCADAKSFLGDLLLVEESKRLGCRENGFQELMSHPYFKEIDWEVLRVKHMEAEFRPEIKKLDEIPKYRNFNHMMSCINEMLPDETDWSLPPQEKLQRLFDDWDFINPITLKVELGIAHAMDVSNMSLKARSIMGV